MPEDDASADDAPRGRPLPPEDRLWRHPSEVAWPAQAASSSTAAPAGPSSRRVWVVALASGLTGAALALALVSGFGSDVTERVVERVPVDDDIEALQKDEAVPAVAEAMSPSVVGIEVANGGERIPASGLVLRDDGTIIMNAHVLAGADHVMVVRSDGAVTRAVVVGSDRLTDVAVVAVEDEDLEWEPAVVGSSTRLQMGQTAVAVAGGPLVTVGVVSGLGRRVTAGDLVLHGMIQTDLPVAAGATGGPLCDLAGVVVGLTTALGTGDGLGFAIPIEDVRAVAEQLLGEGTVRWSWLGIEGADLDATDASLPGLAEMGGVQVVAVDDRGPAHEAGIAAGDVVVAVGGARVSSMSDLVAALRRHHPGDVVGVELRRGAETVSVDVELAERPS